MTSRPRVSIGLPVYNGEDLLPGAIESILAQDFADFELIVSDNGSTDRTPEICEKYGTVFIGPRPDPSPGAVSMARRT